MPYASGRKMQPEHDEPHTIQYVEHDNQIDKHVSDTRFD